MANKFLSKKIVISAAIFFGGLAVASGVFLFSNFYDLKSLAAPKSQWTQETGMGTSVPACTSSSALATCSGGGFTRVEFNWSYDGLHGACTSAQIRFLLAQGPMNSRMAYGVINNKLYIAQGSQLGTGGRYYDPVNDNWPFISSAPAGATAPASAVANGRLYSFETATYEYNPSTDTWATRTPPPIDLTWAQAATVDNIIYVIKGTYNYAYNPATDNWTSKESPPTNHGNWPAVAQANGIIYAIGGSYPPSTTVDAYNPLTNIWASKMNIPAPYPPGKGYASAAAYGGKIYVFGGGDWDASTAETWEYNPSGDQWTRKIDMPTVRNVPAVGVINNKIYVYGGEYPGVYSSAIHHYDPVLDSYSDITGLACPPETSSYIWNGGVSNRTYNYVVNILSGSSIIDVSNRGSFITSNCIPADLIIQSPDISGALVSGNNLSFSGRVKNQGGVTAGASQTRLQIDIGNNGSWDITLDNPTSPIDADKNKKIDWDDAWTAQAGTHSYRIIADATNQVSESNESNNDTGPITFTVTPAPPEDFTLNPPSAACNSVSLSWTASTGADGYRILKGAARVDITPYNPYTALNFTDTSVSQNTFYIYQIEAYNGAGTNRSNARNVTTPYCPPTLDFSGDPTSIFQGQSSTLTWDTTYTTSCTASGAWSGSKATNNSIGEIVFPSPPPSVTYNLQCSGPGGSIGPQSVIISITPLALPEWKEIIPR